MIKKIISGGQTGADQGALDAAIKLDIPHGGWIPRGRITENGPLPESYDLQETSTPNYSERTEKNVVDSEGTLIISHGVLTGGSEFTREMAKKHQRPWLHVDLDQTPAFQAATVISDWILTNHVEVLNVAGPRASKDPKIYQDTIRILESVYHLNLIKSGGPGSVHGSMTPLGPPPQTVKDAVDQLVSQMSLKDKATLANMTTDELTHLQDTLGRFIMNNFGLWSGNDELLASCRSAAADDFHHRNDASMVIIKELWQQLKETHKLRVIK